MMLVMMIVNKVASIVHHAVVIKILPITMDERVSKPSYYFWSDLSVRNRVALPSWLLREFAHLEIERRGGRGGGEFYNGTLLANV